MNVDPLPIRDTDVELVKSLQRQIGQLQRRRPTIQLPGDDNGPALVCIAALTATMTAFASGSAFVPWTTAPVNPDGLWDAQSPTRINLPEPGEWELSYNGIWNNLGTNATNRGAAILLAAAGDSLPAVSIHAQTQVQWPTNTIFISLAGFCRVMTVRPTSMRLQVNHNSAVNTSPYADASQFWELEAKRVGPLRV